MTTIQTKPFTFDADPRNKPWRPLAHALHLIGVDWQDYVGDFMHMGDAKPLFDDANGIDDAQSMVAYKHIDTRRYLVVDPADGSLTSGRDGLLLGMAALDDCLNR